MKNYKLLFVFIVSFFVFIKTYGTAYVSAAAGPANWTTAASWTPNGIPTSNDDVTIAAGHTITNNSTTNCRNLTVNGTLSLGASAYLTCYGNYLVTGTESGSASSVLVFGAGIGTTISGSGTFSNNVKWGFVANRTILAGTGGAAGVTKTSLLTIATNITVRNQGKMTLFGVSTFSGATFINDVNSNLTITGNSFMTGRIFNASASGNTVTLKYAGGGIPTTASGYYNLILASVATANMTLSSNTIVLKNLTMNAGNNLKTNNFDLSVGGNWLNNATFTASAGKTLTFNGTTAQTVSNTLGTTTFTGLAVNNNAGVTLITGTYILKEVLTISNGTFNTGGRSFTMISTAAQTARIAPITGSGAIAGNFTIQRFITTRDSTWSDLSSPVQSSTFSDWANELPAISYSTFPTQYTYDEAADAFNPITSPGTALTPGQGFEVFLTGSYAYANLPNTTINTIGVPNQADQDLSGLISFSGAGSNLVGNPFASSISWSSVFAASSGINNTYDEYDYTAGNYRTFGLGTEIGSGQGFWVYTNSAAATLIVPESAKTASSNSSLRSNVIEPYFTLQLSSNDLNNNYFHVLKINSDNTSSDGWDNNDHPYRKSPNKLAPSIYTSIDGKKAVINSFNSSDDNFSMPVAVTTGISGYYKITASGFDNVSDYSCIKLEDKTLNKFVDLTNGEAYSFELKTDDNSERFVLHFSKAGDCKSVASNKPLSPFENQVTVLPTSQGNSISFKMTEATPSLITVTNVLGQNIIEATSIVAETQTMNIALPENFSGMYIIKVESAKGVVIKKFVRK